MRVLIITEYFPSLMEPAITGGVEARAWFVSRLLARNHAVVVLTSWRRGLPRGEGIDRVRVLRVGPHHPYSNDNQVMSRFAFAAAAAAKGRTLGRFEVVDGQNFIAIFRPTSSRGVPALERSPPITRSGVATGWKTRAGWWVDWANCGNAWCSPGPGTTWWRSVVSPGAA